MTSSTDNSKVFYQIIRNQYLLNNILRYVHQIKYTYIHLNRSYNRIYEYPRHRYSDWLDVVSIIKNGHVGLIRDRFKSNTFDALVFTNQAIELVCRNVTDYETFKMVYEAKKDMFLSPLLIDLACKGGTKSIVKILQRQTHPIKLARSIKNEITNAISFGHLELVKYYVEKLNIKDHIETYHIKQMVEAPKPVFQYLYGKFQSLIDYEIQNAQWQWPYDSQDPDILFNKINHSLFKQSYIVPYLRSNITRHPVDIKLRVVKEIILVNQQNNQNNNTQSESTSIVPYEVVEKTVNKLIEDITAKHGEQSQVIKDSLMLVLLSSAYDSSLSQLLTHIQSIIETGYDMVVPFLLPLNPAVIFKLIYKYGTMQQIILAEQSEFASVLATISFMNIFQTLVVDDRVQVVQYLIQNFPGRIEGGAFPPKCNVQSVEMALLFIKLDSGITRINLDTISTHILEELLFKQHQTMVELLAIDKELKSKLFSDFFIKVIRQDKLDLLCKYKDQIETDIGKVASYLEAALKFSENKEIITLVKGIYESTTESKLESFRSDINEMVRHCGEAGDIERLSLVVECLIPNWVKSYYNNYFFQLAFFASKWCRLDILNFCYTNYLSSTFLESDQGFYRQLESAVIGGHLSILKWYHSKFKTGWKNNIQKMIECAVLHGCDIQILEYIESTIEDIEHIKARDAFFSDPSYLKSFSRSHYQLTLYLWRKQRIPTKSLKTTPFLKSFLQPILDLEEELSKKKK